MFYLGKKDWDRRGSVGTHHYTSVNRLKTREDLLRLKDTYTLVALENSVPGAVKMDSFEWPENPLIIIGEEGIGITPETLEICDHFVFIPQYGSVRSLNAAVAGSIAMYDFTTKYNNRMSN
jgi:tRNA G18 (ribose-2'-O)-methylase SpoU